MSQWAEVYRFTLRARHCVIPSKQIMPLWKLTLAYDGTDFFGWQVQPGHPTIQGELSRAIQRLTGEIVLPQGSGRTDAGVHALAQVASVALETPIPSANLQRALNELLPRSVRILMVEERFPPFHARHSACWKSYEYRIYPLRTDPRQRPSDASLPPSSVRVCDPMLARYVWECPYVLDVEAMNAAAGQVLGRHDFTSFAAAASLRGDPYVPAHPLPDYPETPATPCRTLLESVWTFREDLLVYTVRGSGFLHHMVRNLVGTFVQIGAGRWPATSVAEMLRARSRSATGPTAPARGLFLRSVEY